MLGRCNVGRIICLVGEAIAGVAATDGKSTAIGDPGDDRVAIEGESAMARGSNTATCGEPIVVGK